MITTSYLLMVLGLATAATPEPAHITPMVTLVERADALRQLLPGAARYFVRDVAIGNTDLAKLKDRVRWAPEERRVRFYYARDESGEVVGAVTFARVDTRHGAVVVAVGFRPDDRIREVIVTQTAEETIPWVREALSADWTDAFQGVAVTASIPTAEAGRKEIGAMARYMGKAITAGVLRATALYTLLYQKAAENPAS